MEQNLPEDYVQLLVSSNLRENTAEVWDQINWIWNALDSCKLAMVDVGGTTLKESLVNCFKSIQPAGSWPTGAEVMSIQSAIFSFAKAHFIEIEIYHLTRDGQGNRLSCNTDETHGGLIYRVCVLPNLRCVLVVGGNSKEIQLREKRTKKLKKLVDLISQLKNNSDEISKRFAENYETYMKKVLPLLDEQRKPLIGVLGTAGAGKSTLINGLVGSRLLPSRKGVQSVTAFPTILSFADIDGFDIHFEYMALFEVLHILSHVADATAEEDPENPIDPKDPRSVFLKLINSGITTNATTNQKAKMLIDALTAKDLTGLDLTPDLLDVFKHIIANEMDFSHQKTPMAVKNLLNGIPDQKNALIKKVTIKARFESLRLVDLVDLPGLGDVIEHRSQLTLTFIKKECNFLFYVRKERFGESESELYKCLLDLQARFAIIYTSFFQLDESSVENLLSQYHQISDNDVGNFSRCLVAKHFNEIQALRSAGTTVESKTKEENKEAQSKLSQDYTSCVPIITLDSLWKEDPKHMSQINFEGETAEVPACLSNLPTAQYYLQYIANAFIKEHSDEMAEVMEKWFQSIQAARKKPLITEELLKDLVQRYIKVDHAFNIAKLDSDQLRVYLADFVSRTMYATQLGVTSCFRRSNGYVRGIAWKNILYNAIGKYYSFPDVNAEYYRNMLHTLRPNFDATLLPIAATLVHQVLDYVANSLAALNEHIATETAKVEQMPLLARLPVTVTKRVHDLTGAATKYLNSLLDNLLTVVHANALPRYNFAYADSGKEVVSRVAGLLSEYNFVSEILEAEKEYVVNIFVPEFYNFLAREANSILVAVAEDAKITFSPLTVGTPVTLEELTKHPHFREIVALLRGIAEDAKALN